MCKGPSSRSLSCTICTLSLIHWRFSGSSSLSSSHPSGPGSPSSSFLTNSVTLEKCACASGVRGGAGEVVGTPAVPAVCAPHRASDLLQRLVQGCDPRAPVAADVWRLCLPMLLWAFLWGFPAPRVLLSAWLPPREAFLAGEEKPRPEPGCFFHRIPPCL